MIKGLFKLAILIIITSIIINTKNLILVAFFSLILILLSFFVSGKSAFLGRIKILISVSFMILIFQLIFNSSTGLYPRVITATIVSLKIFSVSLAVFIYTKISSLSEIIFIFSFFPPKITLFLTMTFSMIPEMVMQTEKINIIQNSRGYHNNLLFWRNPFPVLLPLLHRTMKKSENLILAILSKGYKDE